MAKKCNHFFAFFLFLIRLDVTVNVFFAYFSFSITSACGFLILSSNISGRGNFYVDDFYYWKRLQYPFALINKVICKNIQRKIPLLINFKPHNQCSMNKISKGGRWSADWRVDRFRNIINVYAVEICDMKLFSSKDSLWILYCLIR